MHRTRPPSTAKASLSPSKDDERLATPNHGNFIESNLWKDIQEIHLVWFSFDAQHLNGVGIQETRS